MSHVSLSWTRHSVVAPNVPMTTMPMLPTTKIKPHHYITSTHGSHLNTVGKQNQQHAFVADFAATRMLTSRLPLPVMVTVNGPQEAHESQLQMSYVLSHHLHLSHSFNVTAKPQLHRGQWLSARLGNDSFFC